MRSKLTTIGAGVAIVVLVGIGGGIAVAASGDGDPATAVDTTARAGHQAQTQQQGREGRKGTLLRKVQHGELTVGGRKNTRTLLVQRGTVEAMDGRTLRVQSKDGFVASYSVGEQSAARKDGQKVELGEIAAGDTVGLVATKSGDTATLKVVRERRAR